MSSADIRNPSSVAVDYDPFADAPLARVVPSTEPQREIWLAAKLEPEASLAYNESVSLRLHGALDVVRLEAALQSLIDRHEALRATLGSTGEEFMIAEHADLGTEVRDLSKLDASAREAEIAATLRRVVETPFNLEKGPLIRAEILSFGDDDHLLVVTAHHIVCDGWSWGVLVNDLAALYRGGSALPAPDSFGDFAVAQAAEANSEAHRADEAYWLARFTGSVPSLDLPTDRPRPRRRTFTSLREDRTIDATLVAEVKSAGAKRRASLYATLLATFGVLLQRLSGQDDVVIGIPAAGQAAGGHETLVGHAVNVLPLRAAVDPSAPFADILERVRKDLLDTFEHQQYTIGTLLKRLAFVRDASRLPLCSVLFNLDQALDESTVEFPGLNFEFYGNPRTYENFEIFINAVQVDGALRLECQFNSDLFDAATVRSWLDAYEALLRAVVADASVPASRLTIVSPASRTALLNLQPAATPFDAAANAASLFFAQAAEAPTRTAIRCAGKTWNYAELAARAGSIASALNARGVGAGALVGICLERSPDMVASVMGVLATGAGYVPLDPAFPRERLDFMSKDAQLALLLTQDSLAGTIDWPRDRTLALEAIKDDASVPTSAHGGGEDVAYVIYTSGSTGKPKGVRVPHRGVVNFLASMRAKPGLGADDRLVAVTTLSFDIAVLELYLPLTVGAEIVLATREESMDGHVLAKLVADSKATVMQATPSTWRLLLEAGWNGGKTFKILCGGEALPADLAAKLIERSGSLWNMYGPTETTVWSTCERVEHLDAGISIGHPIDNTQVWILDADRQLCPIGVPGEIAIGGAGVTLGYLDRPELTADRFVADTFGANASARVYRTGDRGRWRGDGRIEHLGRLDFQVKLRGFRIELGEIETTLAAHADVAQAVTIVREDRPGDQRLVAYLALRPGASLDEGALRKHLRATLPDYMVPQHFIALRAIPLLPNGKIDRKALPAPFTEAAQKAPAVAPRDDIERRIADAMEATLALPEISVHDDFFALGGHSLLAAQLTARLNREFGAALSLRTLFDAPTIAGLADVLRNADSSAAETRRIEARREQQTAPLSLLQKRLWLFEQLQPGSVVYNTPSAHRLRGVLDEAAFERAFCELVQRQAALRTSIEYAGEEVVQRIHDDVAVSLFPAEDLSALPADQREATLLAQLEAMTNTPFDLTRAPLFTAKMFRLGPEEHALFFMPHHIVWDGWSFDLFYEEFSELYSAYREKRESKLAPLPVSYGDFAEWHGRWMQGPEYAAQFQRKLAWWRDRLGTRGTPPALPTDKPRKEGLAIAGTGETEWMRLSADISDQLRAAGREADATVFMVLLAAYYAQLWRLTGDSNLVVGTPVRVRASDDVEKIMGLFTNLLPLALDVDPAMRFVDLVKQVKKTTLDGFSDPDVQLEDLLHEPSLRDIAGTAAFYQAQFSYQDARQRIREWGGLKQEQILLFQRASSEDFALWFLEHGAGMTGGLLYNADLFTSDTAKRFAKSYQTLLQRIIADPQQSIFELTRADADDAAQIERWKSSAPAPSATRLDAQIEAAVARFADRDALTSGSWGTSYAEIGRRARRIGSCLRKRGAARGTTVGLCAAPGPNRVAAMLGILRTGASCALLDSDGDAASVRAAADALGAAILVGEGRLGTESNWPRERALWLDSDGAEIAAASTEDNANETDVDATALATCFADRDGALHRVEYSHRRAAALVDALRDALRIDADFAVVAAAEPGSSRSWLEALLALTSGGVLIEASRSERTSGEALARLSTVREKTVMFAPASTWQTMIAAGWKGGKDFKAVCTDGDLASDLASELLQRCGEIWNAFGAEGAPIATLRRVADADAAIDAGKPLAGATLSVLDCNGGLSPIGAIAAIHVGDVSTHRCGRWRSDGSIEVIADRARARVASDRAASAVEPTPAAAPVMSDAEQWLAGIWQELLGVPEVKSDDNFFDLGGHSLLAMSMVAKVEKLTRVRLNLLKIANSTLRALAAELPANPEEAAAAQESAPSIGKRLRGLFGFGKREGGE